MLIVKPDEVRHLQITPVHRRGANADTPPKSVEGNLVQIALSTKSVVTELKMIPNQPLVFAGETEGRKEDSLIAYTWDKFLAPGDPKWPARLPMTKAAVRPWIRSPLSVPVRKLETRRSTLSSFRGVETGLDNLDDCRSRQTGHCYHPGLMTCLISSPQCSITTPHMASGSVDW